MRASLAFVGCECPDAYSKRLLDHGRRAGFTELLKDDVQAGNDLTELRLRQIAQLGQNKGVKGLAQELALRVRQPSNWSKCLTGRQVAGTVQENCRARLMVREAQQA